MVERKMRRPGSDPGPSSFVILETAQRLSGNPEPLRSGFFFMHCDYGFRARSARLRAVPLARPWNGGTGNRNDHERGRAFIRRRRSHRGRQSMIEKITLKANGDGVMQLTIASCKHNLTGVNDRQMRQQ